MHYYQFNIADYRKDTVHLTPIEHYIYRSLIDWYFLDEAPIPKETQTVMRRLSLGSDWLESLNNVLQDFFTLDDCGWVHGRINDEIEHYHSKAETNRTNGRLGGRPTKQQVANENNPKITQSVNSANPSESESNPNQEPRTNNQEPITSKKSKDSVLATTDLEKKVVGYRKSIKKPLKTNAGVNGVIKNLNLTATAWDVSIDTVFDYMAEKEWQSINKDYTNPFANKQAPQQAGGSSIPQNIKILNPGALL